MSRINWSTNLQLTWLCALGYWLGSDHATLESLGFWAVTFVLWCLLDLVWSWWRHRNDDLFSQPTGEGKK